MCQPSVIVASDSQLLLWEFTIIFLHCNIQNDAYSLFFLFVFLDQDKDTFKQINKYQYDPYEHRKTSDFWFDE